MKKNINITDVLTTGHFDFGLKSGLTKFDVEKLLGRSLGTPDIDSPDVDYYYVDMETGLCLIIIFDKAAICYQMKINLEDNTEVNLVVQSGEKLEKIDRETSIDKIVAILSQLNIEWEFDANRVYMQTAVILLENGLGLFYAFGDKKVTNYGLFSICSDMKNHIFPPPALDNM